MEELCEEQKSTIIKAHRTQIIVFLTVIIAYASVLVFSVVNYMVIDNKISSFEEKRVQ